MTLKTSDFCPLTLQMRSSPHLTPPLSSRDTHQPLITPGGLAVKGGDSEEEFIGPSRVLTAAGGGGSRLGWFLSDNGITVSLHRPLWPVLRGHPKFTLLYEELSKSHCLSGARWLVNVSSNTQSQHRTRTHVSMGKVGRRRRWRAWDLRRWPKGCPQEWICSLQGQSHCK